MLTKQGETEGLVTYDETCDVTLKGEVPAAGALDLLWQAVG
ncbi:hypothetical protein [Rubritalea tangerina]|uniref:Uncharacterized protein n=1 Tax=Rubritalea tangerina TaxID=430798 RepID=A0ABW4Z803_9BACT